MAQVGITINDQHYTVTCDDGQEERLLEMAAYFDSHVKRIGESVGQIADSRLMLLAGLTICDELKDAHMRLMEMEQNGSSVSESQAAKAIETASNKVQEISDRLEEVSSST